MAEKMDHSGDDGVEITTPDVYADTHSSVGADDAHSDYPAKKGLFEDTNFWFTISFFLFIALLIKVGFFSKITGGLDKRSQRIAHDLDEARRLRAEAEALKASYDKKLEQAEQDAKDIVKAAEKNAKLMEKQAAEDLKVYTERKKKAFQDRIEVAEKALMDELKADVAERSLRVVEDVLSSSISAKGGSDLISSGIDDLKKALN